MLLPTIIWLTLILCFRIGSSFVSSKPKLVALPSLQLSGSTTPVLQSSAQVPQKAGVTSSYNTAFNVFAAQGVLSACASKSTASLPFFLLVGANLHLLAGAQARGRLDGNTFKLLGLGTGISIGLEVLTKSRTLFPAAAFLGVPLTPLWGKLAMTSSSIVCLLQLMKSGLPKLKVSLVSPVPRLALSYLLTMIPSLCVANLFFGLPALPLVAAVHLACHGAALVGPKRLASDTYMNLNYLLCALQAFATICVSRSPTSSLRDVVSVVAAGLPVLLTACAGIKVGLEGKRMK